ncbi:hypothetical protein TeGR_g14803, partial [Tetraparma gracilis]
MSNIECLRKGDFPHVALNNVAKVPREVAEESMKSLWGYLGLERGMFSVDVWQKHVANEQTELELLPRAIDQVFASPPVLPTYTQLEASGEEGGVRSERFELLKVQLENGAVVSTLTHSDFYAKRTACLATAFPVNQAKPLMSVSGRRFCASMVPQVAMALVIRYCVAPVVMLDVCPTAHTADFGDNFSEGERTQAADIAKRCMRAGFPVIWASGKLPSTVFAAASKCTLGTTTMPWNGLEHMKDGTHVLTDRHPTMLLAALHPDALQHAAKKEDLLVKMGGNRLPPGLLQNFVREYLSQWSMFETMLDAAIDMARGEMRSGVAVPWEQLPASFQQVLERAEIISDEDIASYEFVTDKARLRKVVTGARVILSIFGKRSAFVIRAAKLLGKRQRERFNEGAPQMDASKIEEFVTAEISKMSEVWSEAQLGRESAAKTFEAAAKHVEETKCAVAAALGQNMTAAEREALRAAWESAKEELEAAGKAMEQESENRREGQLGRESAAKTFEAAAKHVEETKCAVAAALGQNMTAAEREQLRAAWESAKEVLASAGKAVEQELENQRDGKLKSLAATKASRDAVLDERHVASAADAAVSAAAYCDEFSALMRVTAKPFGEHVCKHCPRMLPLIIEGPPGKERVTTVGCCCKGRRETFGKRTSTRERVLLQFEEEMGNNQAQYWAACDLQEAALRG